MDSVRHMAPEEQFALIEHAVATSIRYATTRKDDVLIDWAREMLTSMRLAASKAYQAAAAGHRSPGRRLPGISAKDLLSGLHR